MSGPVITFWATLFATERGSEWRPEGWEPLFKRLSESKPFRGDQEHPGWSAARFEPCARSLENVREVFALCLDYDNKGKGGTMIPNPVTIARAAELWGGCLGVIHTSRSHTADWPRFRVVLPLSRPVSKFEYAALWLRVKAHAGAVDDAPKDPSRFWFLPGVKEGGVFEAHRLSGPALDVDGWLARPEPRPEPEPRRDVPRQPVTPDRMRVLDRARKYIAKMEPAISGQSGHDATFSVACVLARGFDLDEETTFQLLRDEYNPRCQPAWKDKELRHKAKQARAKSGDKPNGHLLNADDGWTPPARQRAPMPIDDDFVSEPPEGYEDGSEREPGDDSESVAKEKEAPKPAVDRYCVSTLHAMVVEVFNDAKKGPTQRGYTTGFTELDVLIGGYRIGYITLLAAMTSWGKSSFSLTTFDQNQMRRVRTLVVSNEDRRLLYGKRYVAAKNKLNALRMRDGELTPKEIADIGDLANRTPDDYCFLDATGMCVEDVGLAITELMREEGFTLVIADYIQRFKSKRQLERRHEVTFVGHTLSDAIKIGGGTGLLLSQLKRTEGKEPTLDDVKESGDLENCAEHVGLGWRQLSKFGGKTTTSRKLCFPKNKDGPVDANWLELPFDDVTASFIPNVKLELSEAAE